MDTGTPKKIVWDLWSLSIHPKIGKESRNRCSSNTEAGFLFLCSLYDPQGLLYKYGGSILAILKAVYPLNDWDELYAGFRRPSTQMVVFSHRIIVTFS